MKQPHDIDTILDFLSGRMNEEEKRNFEAALAADADLADEVALQKSVLQFVDQSGDLKMKERLKEILPKHREEKVRPSRRLVRWLIPAVAAAVLFLLLLLPRMLEKPAGPQELYAANYETYKLSFASRGGEDKAEILRQADDFFQKGQYSEAIPLFQQLIAQNPDGKLRFALGICQLETQQYAPALQTLQVLIDTPDPVYEEQAKWYSALAHLKWGNIDTATQYLQELAKKTDAYQHKDAVQLLKNDFF